MESCVPFRPFHRSRLEPPKGPKEEHALGARSRRYLRSSVAGFYEVGCLLHGGYVPLSLWPKYHSFGTR